MAVTLKGFSPQVAVQITPNTTQINLPDISVGDWVIVTVTVQQLINADVGTLYVPSGWTTVVSPTNIGTMAYHVYAKTYERPSDLLWSRDNGIAQQVSAVYGNGSMPVTNWTMGSFVGRAVNATNLTTKAGSLTVSKAGMSVAISVERTLAAETDVQVSNFEKIQFTNTGNTTSTVTWAKKSMSAAGATGDVVFTYPNTHASNGIAGQIFIPESAPVAEGLPAKMVVSNNTVSGKVRVVNSSGMYVSPKAMRKVSEGYGSVTNMLSLPAPYFRIAHRGGSVSFPEMSMHAYTQSAMIGYNALEMSLARSSDGVIYGLHDETLLRTSGIDVTPESLTWEQTQVYTTFGKPFLRFEDLVEMYPNHVIFVDPKHIPHNLLGEVLDIMDANGPQRFVAKYFGISSEWSRLARLRGYLTWGYFYEANVDSMDAYQDKWDILGMDYNANQASWNKLLGYGKRVIGHICPNNAAAQTALTKGATGLMVSGTKLVVP